MRFERLNELLAGDTVGYRCDAFGALSPADQDAAWAQCGVTGTIIDIGGTVYGLKPRGHGFVEIVDRLRTQLLPGVAA